MKITIICGSRRKNSLTRKLTELAFEHLEKDYKEVRHLDLGKTEIESFRGFEEEYGKETREWVKIVESSEVLIIGCPIYNGLLSSGVKNLFEHVNYKSLEGAVAGLIIVSSSPASWQQVRGQLIALMNYFNILTNPRPVFASNSDFDKDGNLVNEAVRKRIIEMVDKCLELKKKLG